MFRNVRFYRMTGKWPGSEAGLSDSLAEVAFIPCGPLSERSAGWMSAVPEPDGLLARRLSGADLVRLRSQSRILPPAAIAEELESRVAEYQQRMGEAPSAREKRKLKADIRDELLPKAMLKSDKIWGYVDLEEKIIGIDTAQALAAERFLERLRAPFGALNIRPLAYQKPVSALLTSILLGRAQKRFQLGRECRMRDATDPGSVVRWSEFDLDEKTIRDHIANGMQLTHLAIEYDNVLGCVLDENGVISKLRFIGMDDDSADHHDELARQDAEFALATGTLRALVNDLKKTLGGYAKIA